MSLSTTVFLLLLLSCCTYPSFVRSDGSVSSSITTLTLDSYPDVIHTSAPFISVSVVVPRELASPEYILVVDVIAESSIVKFMYTTMPASRGVQSAPDQAMIVDVMQTMIVDVIVPLAKDAFQTKDQPYMIHAWVAKGDISEIMADGVPIWDPSKLSKALQLITSKIDQSYDAGNTICVKNDYIGFALPLANFGPTLFSNAHDLIDQGINLFRVALPKPLKNANLDLDTLHLKSIVKYLQDSGAQSVIDLPMFYKSNSVPFKAVLDAFQGEGNIFLVPQPANDRDENTVFTALSSALKGTNEQVLFPTQIVFYNLYGIQNVIAHRELKVVQANDGCFVQPFDMGEVKLLTEQLREANFRGLISNLNVQSSACVDKVHELLDYLSENSDVWVGWVWDSVNSYQVAPEYSICGNEQQNAIQAIFGEGSSGFVGTKLYVLIACVVAIAAIIMILTGLTLWMHLKRTKSGNIELSKSNATRTSADMELRHTLRQPNPNARQGRYPDGGNKLTFVDFTTTS
eukprot:TRINITY_DN4423_c0_g1_i1.p1 TRINITY_DN4423_c0_g1~~TRINITY_DN4423_c0_g1_i1.p1  ORF type:complete len:516 (+),score=107.71 TRINITY_DN4423_c0_g1_i1:56-1603(+)